MTFVVSHGLVTVMILVVVQNPADDIAVAVKEVPQIGRDFISNQRERQDRLVGSDFLFVHAAPNAELQIHDDQPQTVLRRT